MTGLDWFPKFLFFFSRPLGGFPFFQHGCGRGWALVWYIGPFVSFDHVGYGFFFFLFRQRRGVEVPFFPQLLQVFLRRQLVTSRFLPSGHLTSFFSDWFELPLPHLGA